MEKNVYYIPNTNRTPLNNVMGGISETLKRSDAIKVKSNSCCYNILFPRRADNSCNFRNRVTDRAALKHQNLQSKLSSPSDERIIRPVSRARRITLDLPSSQLLPQQRRGLHRELSPLPLPPLSFSLYFSFTLLTGNFLSPCKSRITHDQKHSCN